MNNTLSMWCVYKHPSDYPNAYVARRWVASAVGYGPTTDVITASTLDELRTMLKNDKRMTASIPRLHGEDACIVETWL